MGTSRFWAKKTIFFISVATVVFLMVVPVYVLARISVSVPNDVMTQHPKFLITQFTFKHWAQVLASGNLWDAFSKSFLVATFTAVMALVFAVPASYVISRFNNKVKYAIIMALFFTRMVPNVGIALPITVTFMKWNLLDTHMGLIMAHLIEQLPFITWILVSTFESIPVDIEEAGMIDGASKLRILRTLILPVAAPGIAVAAMLTWLNSWNEFAYARYLSLSTRTLPLEVFYYVSRGGFFQQAAYATILTIPVLVLTYVLQKYLKGDYLSGSVKG